jgi:methylmalonyl-CoA mutase
LEEDMTLLADLALTQTFPGASDDQWRKAVEAALKGGAFDKLISKTADGIAIQPLYAPARHDAVTARGAAGAWAVMQSVDNPDPAAADAQALEDLNGGASGLTLRIAGAATARGFGLKADTADALDKALANVRLDWIALRVDAGAKAAATAALLAEVVARRGLDAGKLTVDFGVDPISDLARAGGKGDAAAMAESLAGVAKALAAKGFKGRVAMADGRAWHEAGASEGEELACVLASAVETLRLFEKGGLSLEAARDQIAFLLAADADEFLTLAKFRALRRLWARVEQASGLSPKPIRLHGETAWRMTTRRDPWVNLLRATVAVFSAGLGGADAVTVLPFTAALGLADAHARRMARNTQLILLEESNLSRVVDPAAGAGGFATLTDQLCEKAWAGFQEIEREGGLLASLAAGKIQARVAAVAAERAKAIARRKLPLTGASEFPNVHEAKVDVLSVAPTAPAAPGAVGALPSHRDAEAFEALRDQADARGARPKVFLANLGPVAAFTARATFAKNFFEAGGVEALGNDGFASQDAIVAAFKASGAKLACLCSSDAVYAEQAAAAAKALKGAGASVYLAGRPGELEAALKEAGVIGFVFVGADVLATLKEALALG